MASARTAARNRPTNRRRPAVPRKSWTHRNALWLVAAAAIVVVGALVLFATGDEGGDRSGAGALVGGDLHSLVVDPTSPERIFVGGHQAVSVSEDGGATWQQVPSLENKDAMGWAFTDDAVYVSGHPGLNRSTDGGRTFTTVNDALPDTDLHAFGAGDGVLYAASPAVGVITSEDAGDSWEVATADAGRAFFGRIVVDPNDGDHLLAADVQSGVMESHDGGRTWQQLGPLPAATWISATSGLDVIVSSGPAGAARSDDGGRTWEPLALPDGSLLVEVGNDPATLYAAGLEGTTAHVWVSRDGGDSWNEPT